MDQPKVQWMCSIIAHKDQWHAAAGILQHEQYDESPRVLNGKGPTTS